MAIGVEKYVSGLHVSMHDISLVQRLERQNLWVGLVLVNQHRGGDLD
jgi:hypothetical protein